MTLIGCPECTAPAEITDRFTLPSTDGPIPHGVVVCCAGHSFRMPLDRLPLGEAVLDEEPTRAPQREVAPVRRIVPRREDHGRAA
jgi:hypothetical protein